MTTEQPGIGGPAPLRPLVPHRGTLILVLGILALVFLALLSYNRDRSGNYHLGVGQWRSEPNGARSHG